MKEYDTTGKYKIIKQFRMSKETEDTLNKLMLKVVQTEDQFLTQAACFEKLIGKLAQLEPQ